MNASSRVGVLAIRTLFAAPRPAKWPA